MPEPGVVIQTRASDLKLRATPICSERAKPGKLRLMLPAEECQRRADECARLADATVQLDPYSAVPPS